MSEWVWQGFEGPIDAVIAAKTVIETLPVEVVGVIVPPSGEPPRAWNLAKTRAIFAIQTRADMPVACPEGLEEADPSIVGSMVGA